MDPGTLTAIKALTDAGISGILGFAVWILWRELKSERATSSELRAQLLQQSKSDADRLLEERTVVLPIVRDTTDALRRTTDQLAITTVMLDRIHQQNGRPPPIGSG